MAPLHVVLASPPDPEPIPSLDAWWQRHRALAQLAPRPIDHAVLGGYSADRVGYAFASGYQAALRALIPDLPPDHLASFCLTESGGGHPSAIKSRLEPVGASYRVTGRKRWATRSSDVLLVVATEGADEQGRNRLRLVRVESTAPGVTLEAMPEPPFTPEIGYDEVELAGVLVAAADVFPGDAFTRYARPFRTLEDIHVSAAIFAYLLREIRLYALPRSLAERFAGIIVGLAALAAEDPSAPETHVALAGLLELSNAPIDELDRIWSKTESPAHARWERDRLLLTVERSLREKRRSRAWARLEAQAPIDEDSTAG